MTCKHKRGSFKGEVALDRRECVYECCDCGTAYFITSRTPRTIEVVPNGTVLTDGVRTRTVAA